MEYTTISVTEKDATVTVALNRPHIHNAMNDVLIKELTSCFSTLSNKKNIRAEDENLPRLLKDHAWFVAFAPADKPEIVVSVLVEHGGSGGTVAAPIAKEIINTYFKKDKDV